MSKLIMDFSDGSRLTWKDRETVRFEFDGRYVDVWLDYEPGMFNRGRVLRLRSIENWDGYPAGSDRRISTAEQNRVIDRVTEYLRGRLRIEQ